MARNGSRYNPRENVPDRVGAIFKGALDLLPTYEPPKLPPAQQLQRFMDAVQDPKLWVDITRGKSESDILGWARAMGELITQDAKKRGAK